MAITFIACLQSVGMEFPTLLGLVAKINPFTAMTGGFNPGESGAYQNIFSI